MGNPGKARTVMEAASAKAAEGTPLLGAGEGYLNAFYLLVLLNRK